ncbi:MULTISPECIES: type II toxin-antitoxin system VapC family toxin [unclassified Luteimonas]|uniref:type II toxin-antitoxin system VapC family toxin n=1 Tax=unclassified Luteimonas TaxID=2629088 RepID=UPI0018F0CF6D|nr:MULTISPECIES: type II toxin-antitoxin system VapC family toxin [unclassified Luteimonas]MBJ6977824.1 type II toxin-antitoxin system VapC family toxin [Luteimonas sp. MC1895]MBJ6984643.1 type II toxin-antitoxin system VapC family toxin [Luteimonas sp. MC1750]QQO04755.1 type II toxin-antitoxin system VapC family toxin [Luteimonas sp. MC1750]
MIAIDTSVLIDLLGDDPGRADAAERCVRDALAQGPVVLCDVVVSEITAGLGHGTDIMDVVEEMGMRYVPVERRSAIRAGEMQRRFNQRVRAAGGDAPPSPRTGPDFIVGAHALLQCAGLITRDAGFFRDYFKGLKIIVPKAP